MLTRLTLILASAAAPALAGGPPLSALAKGEFLQGRPGVFPKGKPGQEPLPFRAVDVWGVSPGGRRVTVHWECEALHLVGDDRQEDLTLRLRSQGGAGPVSARVLSHRGTSDIQHRRPAHVSAVVSGAGVAYLQLEMQITDRDSAAGVYEAAVAATITAN